MRETHAETADLRLQGNQRPEHAVVSVQVRRWLDPR